MSSVYAADLCFVHVGTPESIAGTWGCTEHRRKLHELRARTCTLGWRVHNASRAGWTVCEDSLSATSTFYSGAVLKYVAGVSTSAHRHAASWHMRNAPACWQLHVFDPIKAFTLSVRLLEASARSTASKLLWLAATRVSDQQRSVVLQQHVPDLLL